MDGYRLVLGRTSNTSSTRVGPRQIDDQGILRAEIDKLAVLWHNVLCQQNWQVEVEHGINISRFFDDLLMFRCLHGRTATTYLEEVPKKIYHWPTFILD